MFKKELKKNWSRNKCGVAKFGAHSFATTEVIAKRGYKVWLLLTKNLAKVKRDHEVAVDDCLFGKILPNQASILHAGRVHEAEMTDSNSTKGQDEEIRSSRSENCQRKS